MEIEFRTRNEKQLLAAEAWLDDAIEEILYGGAKGGGKSFLGATLIFGDALIYPDTAYFIARKELIDLTNFTIPTIHKVFKNWGLNIDDYAKYNGQNHVYTLTNGSRVHLIACKEEPGDPLFERFGSMEMTRGWIEEGGEVAEAAKANLWLSIGRVNNDKYNLKKKLLITANPKKGWMKRDFVDPFVLNMIPSNRCYIQAFATDNVYLGEDYVSTLRNIRDKVARERLYEGNWNYDESQDSLITYDALSDSFSNTIVKDGQKYMTVDVARLGRDATVVSLWNGLDLYRIEKYAKQTTNETEQRIRDLAAGESIPYSNILIDEDGIGGGVVDHLFGVKGFTANSTPMPTSTEIKERLSKIQHFLVQKAGFANIKSQCGWKIAELFNERRMRISVPEYRDEIVEDLTAMLRTKDVDTDGKKQLRPKDAVKVDIGRSPDLGDTILMRAWFELKKIAVNENPDRAIILGKQLQHMDRVKRTSSSNSTK